MSAADRIIDDLGRHSTLQPRRQYRRDIVLIVDGTMVPTRDHILAEQSKNCCESDAKAAVGNYRLRAGTGCRSRRATSPGLG